MITILPVQGESLARVRQTCPAVTDLLVMKDGAVFAFGGKAVVNAETIRQVYGVHAQVVEYDGRPVVIPQ